MAEGTRYAKIDDAIKSLNEFRKEIETKICDLNNTITWFMQVIDQRMENKIDPDKHTENPHTTVHTPNNKNYQHQSMKLMCLILMEQLS